MLQQQQWSAANDLLPLCHSAGPASTANQWQVERGVAIVCVAIRRTSLIVASETPSTLLVIAALVPLH